VQTVLIFAALTLAGLLLGVIALLVRGRLERRWPGITRRPRVLLGSLLLPPVGLACLVTQKWVPGVVLTAIGLLGWLTLWTGPLRGGSRPSAE
jgi:hypothetical protein